MTRKFLVLSLTPLSFVALPSTPSLAQSFQQMPSGQTVWIPQRQHIPARPYYAPQGGPPQGTVIEHNGIQTFVPYNNQPPSQQGEE